MPRKAPNQVVEHRISLSNFEREQLLKQLELQRENALYTSGIKSAGTILGSGALLWGIGLYFGYNLFDRTKDGIQDWVDKTSSYLSDILTEVTGGLTPEEREFFRVAFDTLDEEIKKLNRQEALDDSATAGTIALMRQGDLSYEEGQAILDKIKESEEQTVAMRFEIRKARNRLLALQSEANKGWVDSVKHFLGGQALDLARAINSL
jgi:hypothetical protein